MEEIKIKDKQIGQNHKAASKATTAIKSKNGVTVVSTHWDLFFISLTGFFFKLSLWYTIVSTGTGIEFSLNI